VANYIEVGVKVLEIQQGDLGVFFAFILGVT
jgi:hypothetical protein